MYKTNQLKFPSFALRLAGLAALVLTMIYGRSSWVFMLVSLIVVLLLEKAFNFLGTEKSAWSPYHMMLFSPVLLVRFTTITDFQLRMIAFIVLVYIFSLSTQNSMKTREIKLFYTSPLTVWACSFLILSLAAIALYRQGIHLSGDEPHYLMITQSLIDDQDFDLKNNVREKTYFNFMPLEIPFHGTEREGHLRSFHLPGVSFLLLPFYWIFRLTGESIPPALFFRLAAAFINSFFGLMLFMLLRREFPGRNISFLWLFFMGTFPLVFHGVHLYPELPAAALLIAAYLAVFRNPGRPLAAGICLAAIPWFHIKYLPALIALAAIVVSRFLFKNDTTITMRYRWRSCFLFLLPSLLGIALLLIYSRTLYYDWNPMHIFPREDFWAVPLLLRIKTFLAYFLDQRDGLLFYSPVFFLFLFSLKREIPGRKPLLIVMFSYTVFHALTSVRGAYSPAGRPLLFISWILIAFLIKFYLDGNERIDCRQNNPSAISSLVWKICAGFSFFFTCWLFYNPLFLYQPVFAATTQRASSLLKFFSSDLLPLWSFFPSFLATPTSAHLANYLWLIGLAITIGWFYLKKNQASSLANNGIPVNIRLIAVWALSIFLFAFHPRFHLPENNLHQKSALIFYNNSRNFQYLAEHDVFRAKVGPSYDLFIDAKAMANKSESLSMTFFKNAPVNITIYSGRNFIFKTEAHEVSSFVLKLEKLNRINSAGKTVIPLTIKTSGKEKNDFFALKISEHLQN